MNKLMIVLLGATALCLGHIAKADVLSSDGQATARYFQSLSNDPNAQLVFLKNMPKGGDLHNHRSGSAYAENMLMHAVKDDVCIDPATLSATTDGNCPDSMHASRLLANETLYNRLIDGWSMRNYVVNPQESGHDHFFATFLKFSAVSGAHRGENLTELVNRAGQQHELYVETMITAGAEQAIAIGSQLKWDNNFDSMRKALQMQSLDKIVSDSRHELDQNEAYLQNQLKCNTTQAAPGCNVTVRYQQIGLRNMPPALVFAQLLTAFEIANQDPRVVAVNIVQAEDSFFAARDYHLHMQMIDYLHTVYPQVHISLHAGELAPGLVTPEQLTFHIRDAIETGHAERIGHGVDIASETNTQQVLQDMASKNIAVEICLTSNDSILNIRGNQHPLPLYLNAGVPVVLATDDEGVLRTDLSHEYQRAAATYGFNYQTLKNLARNSLSYNFMQGKNLWQDPKQYLPVEACAKEKIGAKQPTTACNTYLQQNPKAKLQWNMEADFAAFEQEMAKTHRTQLALH